MTGCAPASCSHTGEILRASSTSQELASGIKADAKAIIDESTSPEPDLTKIVESAVQIDAKADSIVSEQQTIAVNAANVQDTEGAWTKIVRWGLIAVVILAACFLSWYWGLGNLTRALFKRMGWWVDSAEEKRKSELKLAQEVLTGDATPQELVAAMRTDAKSNRLYQDLKQGKKT